MSINTIFPNDFGYWELVHELVQQEPPEAGDPGAARPARRCRDRPRQAVRARRPDAQDPRGRRRGRQRHRPHRHLRRNDPRKASPSTRARRGRARCSSAATSSSTRPREITADGPVAAPSDGARKLNSRTNFFYMATGITPAMCMRLTGIGSQYIYAMRDSEGELPRRRPQLSPHAPTRHPREPLLVDAPVRPPDPLDAPDRPAPARASAASPARVETNPDGSTDIYFGPTAPDGKESNWLQTVPGKGWWTILRLYNPLQPFFDKTWRPGEIEPT